MRLRLISLLVLLLAAAVARSQTESYELGGYVKYLFTASKRPSVDVQYDHLLHGRLNARWYPTENISAVMEVRARAFYGGTVRATPDFAHTLGQDGGFGKMRMLFWNGSSSAAYAEMDRMYINAAAGKWQFTVGRQRIAWGTNLVWNTVDLFNPQSVLDFDYEEKPPVDGVRVQYYTGDVSKVEVAVTPGWHAGHPNAGIQWTFNRWDYDIHILAGVRDMGAYGGLAWAGDIGGGGFRGEVLVSEFDDGQMANDALLYPGAPRSALRTGVGTLVSAALSGDYTFPNSFYIHTEALYSNEGITENTLINAGHATRIGLLSPARWSVFQEFSYDISPLVRGGIFAIYNPTDHSSVIFPSVTWSVLTDLDLSMLGLLFSGGSGTEYGERGAAVVARLRWAY
jgi:hypothetical protein